MNPGEDKSTASYIAHELRTPLAIMHANIELVLMDENLDPKAKKVLQENLKELDKLAHLITTLVEKFQ